MMADLDALYGLYCRHTTVTWMEDNGASLPDYKYVSTSAIPGLFIPEDEWKAWFTALSPSDQEAVFKEWRASELRAAYKRYSTAEQVCGNEYRHFAFGRKETYYPDEHQSDLQRLADAYCSGQRQLETVGA
jgi:hypothetical protein